MQAAISKEGTIKNLLAVSGSALLQNAALEAVSEWAYKPYILNGAPVEVETTIEVKFTLDEGAQPSSPSTPTPAAGAQPAAAEESQAEEAYMRQDYSEALPHFQSAAQAENTAAYSYLGYMYRLGRGTSADLRQAELWFAKSVDAGNQSDKVELDAVQQLLAQQPIQAPPDSAVTTAEETAQTQQATQTVQSPQSDDDNERQQKIASLGSDIEVQEAAAAQYDQSANDIENGNNSNCAGTGLAAALCRTLGEAGAAKERQDANKARQKADDDRDEIAQLEG